MKYFAIHLRDKRTEKGWDQESLAHMAGISVRTIQRIESGQSCSLDTLKSVSAAMDLKHFSELLPQPMKNEYQPKPLDLIRISFAEMFLKNVFHALVLTFCVIGGICFYNTYDMTTDKYYLSVEDRVEAALERIRNIEPNHPLLTKKAEAEVISRVYEQVAKEKVPFSRDQWKALYDLMINTALSCLLITTFFSLFRISATYEFNELVIKPSISKLNWRTKVFQGKVNVKK